LFQPPVFSLSNLSYDADGNILTMNQKGFKVNASSLIDQLSYTYQTNSNKLAKVTDAVSDAATKLGDFHDGANGGTDDYAYDGNGNLNLDNNKAIGSITYNFLNLPNVVTVTGKGTITYTYDAAGTKLKKTTVEGAKTTTTLYISGFVYQNDTLQFIGHEEGRARWAFHKYLNGSTAYGFEYDYFLKDHLGNTRMVLTQQKDTAQYMATMEAAYRNSHVQRGFLKYTAQKIKHDLGQHHPAVLEHFTVDAADRDYQLWQRNPLSIELRTQKVFAQKLDYIHWNPVKAGICKFPEEFNYSSALFYETGKDNWGFLTHYRDS
jgi:hypothetical protein